MYSIYCSGNPGCRRKYDRSKKTASNCSGFSNVLDINSEYGLLSMPTESQRLALQLLSVSIYLLTDGSAPQEDQTTQGQ